jgi:hypothetical protein
VCSAIYREDRASLRSLTRMGLSERALLVMPEHHWFLIRHYGTAQQKKEKARARQKEKDAQLKSANEASPAPAPDDQA